MSRTASRATWRASTASLETTVCRVAEAAPVEAPFELAPRDGIDDPFGTHAEKPRGLGGRNRRALRVSRERGAPIRSVERLCRDLGQGRPEIRVGLRPEPHQAVVPFAQALGQCGALGWRLLVVWECELKGTEAVALVAERVRDAVCTQE